MKKKVLSILLALAMVFSLNAPVLAAGDGEPNTCTHENRIPVSYWQHSPKYIDTGSDKTHEVLGILLTQYYCPDCGEYLPGTTKEFCRETENHTYEDGMVCIACGHRNQCEHRNTFVQEFQCGNVQYVDIGDNILHEVSVTTLWREYCEDCGLYRNLFELTETGMDGHVYDKDGVCTLCGHVNTCPHEHVAEYRVQTSAVYTDTGDNSTHQTSYTTLWYEYCEDCGQVLCLTREEPYTANWIHHYDENGQCTLCGHVNTCTHEHASFGWDWLDDAVYTDIGDNREHEVTGSRIFWWSCPDCLQVFSRWEEYGTVRDPHSYEDGVCTLCGHAASPVTIRTAASKGGKAEGAGTYEFRSFVYLTAIPAENYAFAGWYEDGCLVSPDEVYVFQAENDRTLQPSFLRTTEIPVKPAASFKAAEPVVQVKNTDIPERSLLKK